MNQLKAATTIVLCLGAAVCVGPIPFDTTLRAPIPSRWVDLPEAPFIAELRDGVPVLVTRYQQSFSEVGAGCVVERDGKAHVLSDLLRVAITHGAFGPNKPVTDLLFTLGNLDRYRHLSGSERCTAESFFAVTAAVPVNAGGAEGSTWTAEGTAWPSPRDDLEGVAIALTQVGSSVGMCVPVAKIRHTPGRSGECAAYSVRVERRIW